MSKRILALVSRSGGGTHVTDQTPTVVWDHEIAILEEIHGEGTVEVVEHDNILDNTITSKRREQIEHIVKVSGLGIEFQGDPFEEYQRLTAKYGMHPDVRMMVVEKVYGSFRDGRFSQIVGNGGYEEMTIAQLRELCDGLGIEFRPSSKKPELIVAIREAKRMNADIEEIGGKAA
jgi:hypothetical protein